MKPSRTTEVHEAVLERLKENNLQVVSLILNKSYLNNGDIQAIKILLDNYGILTNPKIETCVHIQGDHN